MSTTENPVGEPGGNGRTYWRSLDELANSPEFREHAEKEFPLILGDASDPVSRRSFLGVVGATLALTGLAGCRRPLAKILPYSKMPEDLLPGVPQTYATVLPFRGMGEGVLVTSHEGRPTKIEGNPEHPASQGATHGFTQASILDLYDPDRSRVPTEKDARRSWGEFAAWFTPKLALLRAGGGAGLALLAEPTPSPALRALRDEVQAAFPKALWVTYEPWNRDAVLEGSRIACGRPLRTQLALEQADVILSLDSDLFALEPNSVRHARDFARRRRITSEKDSMNRLYMVESAFSVTGSMADHRARLAPGQVARFARTLAALLAGEHGVDLGGNDFPGGEGLSPRAEKLARAAAKDLAAHRGRSAVLAGSSQPPEVHALVHVLNHALGNVGPVLRYTEEPIPAAQTAALADLTGAMSRGEISTLVVLGGNPAFDAPADLDFPTAMGKVADVVRLGYSEDETSALAVWHLPSTHPFEAWGDAEAWDGTRAVQQPLIAPLFEGRSELEFLALVLGRPDADGHAMVREFYGRAWGIFSETRWDRALHDGVLPGTAFAEIPVTPDMGGTARAWSDRAPAPAPGGDDLEIAFRADYSVWDGRFAQNGWLQELPDPMTKLVWDNAALLSPRTAQTLGLETGDLVRLGAGGREITIAACVTPGLADNTLVLPLGYGRTRAGRIGQGVGVNTYALRAGNAMQAVSGAKLAKTGERTTLVRTQDHQAMEGRPLVREGSLEEYRKDPDFVKEMVEVPAPVDIYTNKEYDSGEGRQWGMAIDLNTCIGCNACAIACQSENNIAIVGKDQVRRGREMHWIRIDRYYAGDVEEPDAVHQPVPCMHCENAPCEGVCPVNATNHSEEGLNQMVYNRCIGTRYCNNNCPYKVRRFNYLAWRKDMTEIEKMAMNPDVTVRMRGVMEKCTYCVQRINRVKIDARNGGREIRDGEIVTACQQVCPTESIVFGDVNDPGSRVSGLKAQNRNYAMLEEFNFRPRTSYLARIRNPNPELENA
jgi:molybdopterin-containing oxidoreductase family iron-sulfur binding subunit